MSVQWFPGHMNSARKQVADLLARIDVVIEVLDARAPAASSNPMIERLRLARSRPCLKVLNKVDLADPIATRAWLDDFNARPNTLAVALSARQQNDVARIPALCRRLAPHRSDGTKPLRMMIMGIPNVGKSTLMNVLLKRRVAAVGDEPAVTKRVQRIDLDADTSITDTPGLMWPKIEYDSDGYMLAACHAIGVNAVQEEAVAEQLAATLLQRYPAQLASRYGVKLDGMDGWGIVEAVAKRRGCVQRGGGYDMEKAAQILLDDFRSGTLGCISLETPQSRAEMIALAATVNATTTDALDG